VQVSALGVSGEGKTEYQRSKFEGEQVVRRSGLAWTILRPGLIHGARSGFFQMAKGWVKGEKQPWFFLPYFTRGVVTSDVPLAAVRREPASVAPVAVEDVAWGAAESLERDEAVGEVINLVGPETMTWPELLVAIRDAVPGANSTLDPLGIPAEAAAIQARIAKAIGAGPLLPFDEGMALMGAIDSVSERQKARAILGFEARPFGPALRQYAGQI
jgi:NADH dehydrogenase